MGQCHCIGSQSTDEAEDALLRNFEGQHQQRPVGPPPPYQQVPVPFYMLTEEQRLHIISRVTLIQSLPSGRYECRKTHQKKLEEKAEKPCPEKAGAAAAVAAAVVVTATCTGVEKAACPEKADLGEKIESRECPICMNDFVSGDPIRLLPCMHYYHLRCIDDWLMRSLTCPICMQRVDLAMRSSTYGAQPHVVNVAMGAGLHGHRRSASRVSNSSSSNSSSMEQLIAPSLTLLAHPTVSPPTSPLRLVAEVNHH